MSSVAIDFKHVSKSFEPWLDRPNSIKGMLAQLTSFNMQFGKKEKFVVLENINLQIKKGDFVGIMGRNGAGKSTLLKLISGIYRPSSGEITCDGNLVPLLELGAGFASELDGLENIRLNASILGFRRGEVEKKVQQIVEFSELGQDIYKPVRNYSSGMLVRLGFSIAAHLDADILLFDEVLAVGDIGFQSKCLKKIQELHAKNKTIVLVTHTPEQIEKYCSRCIVFEKHGVLFDGTPHEGVQVYRSLFQVN